MALLDAGLLPAQETRLCAVLLAYGDLGFVRGCCGHSVSSAPWVFGNDWPWLELGFFLDCSVVLLDRYFFAVACWYWRCFFWLASVDFGRIWCVWFAAKQGRWGVYHWQECLTSIGAILLASATIII